MCLLGLFINFESITGWLSIIISDLSIASNYFIILIFDIVNFLFCLKIFNFSFPTLNDFSHSFLILINFEYDVFEIYWRLVLIQISTPNMCLNDFHSLSRTLQKCLNLLSWLNRISYNSTPVNQTRNKIKRNTIMAMWLSQVTAWSSLEKCHHVLIRNQLNLSLLICHLSFISCLGTCYPNHSPYLFIYFFHLIRICFSDSPGLPVWY